ncbi:TonB-dependent receptor [Sandaracinobacter sp. RS1-74]|uniref:TonB-dependent receptor n=1 Tax=Sandaracinobacteroides sayramensis TaxID=2913411 RepID=UPI001EDC21E8|nr:TonB-dependent receptor [Sandaracinobacteroides sayramensis]MCG2842745.1 TonB-dependent receptor [Sandaracinobacteroides sayramensis]
MRRFHASAARTAVLLLATTALGQAALASTLTGTIADSTGVRPLQGAEVRIPSLGRVTSADAAGRFRFTDLPAGTHEVVATFAGAGQETQSVTIAEQGTVQINFVLAPEGTDIETILVIGQQANMLSAISRQRAADTVVTVLTRDAIGQFPDQNVAESLRRAPGINVLNDQGEGRFVAVRGLDPELNSTSINGARVPATGGDERTVALDVIPSELVESIEIKKSLTPDMDGDTIGGSIEIHTTSAFDREKSFVGVNVEGGYNKLSEEWSPKIGVDFSTRLTEDFGVSGGFSWNRRKFSTDNVEVGDWVAGEDGGPDYAETIEYRDYDVKRVRWGGNLSLDWRPADSTTLYLRGLYSKFDDTELRTRLVFKPNEPPASGDENGFAFDSADGRIEVRRDLKDRREWQTTTSIVGGGRTEVNEWTLDYMASWSRAEQKEDGSIDPVRFRQRFQGDGKLGVDFDFSDWQRPGFSITQGGADFVDPSKYEFSLMEYTTKEDAVDKEWAFKTDIARNFALANGDFEVKWGGKARLRHKRQSFQYDVYDGFDGDFYLSDVAGTPTYGLANIAPVPDLQKVRDWVKSNRGSFELNQLDTDLASNAENYDAKEDVFATYLQGRFQNDSLRIVGGVRMEHTSVNMRGNRIDLVEEGGIWNGEELDEDTLFITPMQLRNSYTDWLPSLNLRADLSSSIVARAGFYRSLARPKFSDMAPMFSVEENDEGEREGSFGNPDLKPYRAWNGDATIEYYFAPKAVVQAGFFWKSINDFIVDAQFENGSFAGIPFTQATIPINGDSARVLGVEASYSQAFTMLPAPFDGLLLNLNYTYTDAKGTLDDGRKIPLPASSKHNFNAVLGYDKGILSFRVSGAYRDGYLDELGATAEEDRYVRPHFQVDLSAKLRVTDNFTIFADMVNLNNAKYVAYQKGPSQRRLLQYEEYKWTAKFGVKANF